jgi:hypothetical protein
MLLLVKVTGIIRSIDKVGKIVPQSLLRPSKPTYIYLWAHEVESSRHMALRSARTSGGFWETTKSCRLQCKWLFLLVKVIRIIRLVGKPGKIGSRRLSPTSKPTYIYWWAHEVGLCKHIELKSARTRAPSEDFGKLQSLEDFNTSGYSSLSRL